MARPPRLRSLLFVPGNVPKMLRKAAGLASVTDALVPDLEDSVPAAEKIQARGEVRRWLAEVVPTTSSSATMTTTTTTTTGVTAMCIPRVNALGTGLLEDDLEAVLLPGVYAVTVGKVASVADVRAVSGAMTEVERAAGIPVGRTRLIPWVETAQGVVHVEEICACEERIVAVAFGGDDYGRDMELEPGGNAEERARILHYPRARMAVAARAAGIVALDTPWTAFRDREGLAAECRTVSELGFRGKFAIHPDSVAAINAAFSPSAAALDRAAAIVEAYEREQERDGRGSTSLRGQMIDTPVYLRAKELLQRAAKEPPT